MYIDNFCWRTHTHVSIYMYIFIIHFTYLQKKVVEIVVFIS